MLANRLSLTICTDNRLVSHTTVTEEIEKVIKTFNVDAHILRDIIVYGFKRSFSSLPYVEKRAYVRKVIDFYERLEGQYRKI